MFDIGISEIAVIAVVALVVIGPERLPKVARTVGTLLGRAQRYVNDVKAEVNREMELDELRKLQTQMQDAARGIQEQVSTAGAEMQSAVRDVEKTLNESVAPAPAATEAFDPASQHIGLTAQEPPAPAVETASASLVEPVQPGAGTREHPAELTEPPPAAAPAMNVTSAATLALAPEAGQTAQIPLFPEHTIR